MIRARIRARLEPTLPFRVAQRLYHRAWRELAAQGAEPDGYAHLHDIVYAWLFADRDHRSSIVETLRADTYGQRLFRRAGGTQAAFRLFFDQMPDGAKPGWTTAAITRRVYENPRAFREPDAAYRDEIVSPARTATLDEAAASLETIMRVNGVQL